MEHTPGGGEFNPERLVGDTPSMPSSHLSSRQLCPLRACLWAGEANPWPVVAASDASPALQGELDLRWGAVDPPGPPAPDDLRAVLQAVAAVVEVLNRRRPVTQLTKQLGTADYVALHRRTQEYSRLDAPVRLRSLRASQPVPDVIEASATLQHGQRVRALAARLQRAHPGWLYRALRVL